MKRVHIFLASLLTIFLLWGGEVQQTMAATGSFKQALIVVDPGFSKFSLKVAQAISAQLAERQFKVIIKTAQQFKPADLKDVDLLVLGGPTYAGQPGDGLKKAITSFDSGYHGPTLLFITGGSDCSGKEPLHKLVQAKGLAIVGEIAVSTQSKVRLADAVKPLLEKISR